MTTATDLALAGAELEALRKLADAIRKEAASRHITLIYQKPEDPGRAVEELTKLFAAWIEYERKHSSELSALRTLVGADASWDSVGLLGWVRESKIIREAVRGGKL